MINTYNDWLHAIRDAVKGRYGTANAQFIGNNNFQLEQWVSLQLGEASEWVAWIENPENRESLMQSAERFRPDPSYNNWLQYKHIKDTTFELKIFPPNPPDDVCQQLLNTFFEQFYAAIPSQNRDELVFTILGDCVYTEKEIRKELMYLLKTGNAKITLVKGPVKEAGRLVYYLHAQPDTIANMLASGYLKLEY